MKVVSVKDHTLLELPVDLNYLKPIVRELTDSFVSVIKVLYHSFFSSLIFHYCGFFFSSNHHSIIILSFSSSFIFVDSSFVLIVKLPTYFPFLLIL